MKTEAAVSAPIDDKLQTWEPNRKELRVIFELLHRQIFEVNLYWSFNLRSAIEAFFS